MPRAKTALAYLAAFFVPIGCFLAFLAASGIYPFGDTSFLTEDLKYQYIDFFTWYRSVLAGEGSIFYSFASGMGSNAWGMVGYYLASPLNFLIVLFDDDHITDFVVLVVALKLGLAGASSMFYARRRFGLGFAAALALCVAFVFSQWTVCNLRNPLWLDAIVFLPLVALGVHRLVFEGKRALLIASLAAQIAINWYMGYMTVLFTLLLFAVEWAYAKNDSRRNSEASCSQSFVNLLACEAVALLLSCAMFVPSVASLLGSWGTGYTAAVLVGGAVLLAFAVLVFVRGCSARLSSILVRILIVLVCAVGLAGCVYLAAKGKLLASHGLWVVLGSLVNPAYTLNVTPQLFPGVLGWALAVVFFASAAVPARVKAAYGIVLVILLLSAWLKALEVAWCGFHQPSGFYCRIAWLAQFAYFMVSCAAFAVLQQRFAQSAAATGALSVGALALAVGTTLAVAVSTAPVLYGGYTQSAHNAYVSASKDQYDELAATDDSWYRTEKTYTRVYNYALNEGLVTGAHMISAYSSATDAQAALFLKSLGYAHDANDNSRIVSYESPVALTDALFGVKYVSSTYPAPLLADAGLSSVAGYSAYQLNPYALSIGYGASSNVLTASVSSAENPFEAQNELASAILGKDVQLYEPVETQETDANNTKTWSFDTPAGEVAYLYVTDDGSNADSYFGIDIGIDGGAKAYKEDWFSGHSVIAVDSAVGAATRPHSVSLRIDTGDPSLAGVSCMVYALRVDAFEQVMSALSAHQLQALNVEDGTVEGVYESDGDGWLLLSIPYDEGWSVQVNGSTVAAQPAFEGGMMAVPVTSGENRISMHYVSPGIAEGVCVTLCTAIVLVALFVRGKRAQGATGSGKKRS